MALGPDDTRRCVRGTLRFHIEVSSEVGRVHAVA